jgi:PST family polysaccharide transporter
MSKNIQESTLKRLSDNFISLFILQIINYLLPLLMIPYLIRVLGIDGFGIFTFITAIIMYGVKMSDYGFELSATYHISKSRDDSAKKDEIFSSVLIIKSIIALLYMVAIALLIPMVDRLLEYREFIFWGFGMIVGHLLFPVWFFQGIEKMRYIMILNSLSKLIFFVSIFIFVKEQDDLYLVFVLNSIGAIVAGVVGVIIALKKFGIKFYLQPLTKLEFYLKDGWYIFTSKIAVEFYTNINIIILGFFVSPVILGYYAVANKIVNALGSLLDPLTRTVYPYLVNVYQESGNHFIIRNKQLAIVIFVIMLPVSLLVVYFSEFILEIITGSPASALSIEILEILALTLIIYLYGSQFTNILVTIKETKFLNRVLFMGAVANTILAPILVSIYGVMGLVWLNLFIALSLKLMMGHYILVKFSYQS